MPSAGITTAILLFQQELTQTVDVLEQPTDLEWLETFDRNAGLLSLLEENDWR